MSSAVQQERRFPGAPRARRVIALCFVGAVLASGAYLAQNALGLGAGSVATKAPAAAAVEPVTYRDDDGDTWHCAPAVSAESCVIVSPIGNAPYQRLGYPTEVQAAASCLHGTVGKIWRKGRVAGFACDVSID